VAEADDLALELALPPATRRPYVPASVLASFSASIPSGVLMAVTASLGFFE